MNISSQVRHNLLGKGINHLLLFFINVLIVRILGSDKSGTFFNELYVINLVVLLCSFGLDVAATRWLAKDNSYLKAVQGFLFKSIVVFPFIITLFYFVIAPFFRFNFYLNKKVFTDFGQRLVSLTADPTAASYHCSINEGKLPL